MYADAVTDGAKKKIAEGKYEDAITDLDAAQVAETQSALLGELPDVSAWKFDDA